MRTVKVIFIVFLLLLFSACSSTRRGSISSANIPTAKAGGLLADIHFDFDKYNIRSTDASLLRQNASWLTENSDANIEIEGHCDERGTNEYNMALGMKRAKAAYDFLHTLGIGSERMRVISYGEDLPLDREHNEAAWAKNRRAHFRILDE